MFFSKIRNVSNVPTPFLTVPAYRHKANFSNLKISVALKYPRQVFKIFYRQEERHSISLCTVHWQWKVYHLIAQWICTMQTMVLAILQARHTSLFPSITNYFYDHEIGINTDHITILIKTVASVYIKMRLSKASKLFYQWKILFGQTPKRMKLN